MSNIVATVSFSNDIQSTVSDNNHDKTVTAVGIQGLPGTATNGISQQQDVDLTDLTNGSVLVYKTITSKWTSTTMLCQQTMEGGEY